MLTNLFWTSADNSVLFSTLISRTAQDIDILIDALPNQDYTQDRQDSTLRKLEAENRLAAENLKKTVEAGGKGVLNNEQDATKTAQSFNLCRIVAKED